MSAQAQYRRVSRQRPTTSKVSFVMTMRARVNLRCVRPGLWETLDGEWQIVRGDMRCGWVGKWLLRSSDVPCSFYGDPVATMEMAREELETVLSERSSTKGGIRR